LEKQLTNTSNPKQQSPLPHHTDRRVLKIKFVADLPKNWTEKRTAADTNCLIVDAE
jgi:hypothetical protein